MNHRSFQNDALLATATTMLTATAQSGAAAAVEDLVAQIKNPDEKINAVACQNAGSFGAPAISGLAVLLEDQDFETARRAKRAMYNIVRRSTAPGSSKEQKAVEAALLSAMQNRPVAVRRDLLWMLSEVGSNQTVDFAGVLLSDKDLREDARCILLRIPGSKSTAVLRSAYESAPEDFKPALADSLRARGEKIDGCPSEKLHPKKQTTVTPIEEKKK